MRIVISWSGNRSRHVANALKTILPRIIQSLKPWMSEPDISKGSRSMTELFTVLEEAKFGIFCLTPENQNEPWINFEAGAIGKVQGSKVCTYLLCGLKPADITGPLNQFQHSPADENETKKLLQTLNSSVDQQLSSEDLETTFEKFWPDIKQALDSIPDPDSPSHQVKREERDLLEEMLELLRRGEKSQTETTILSRHTAFILDNLIKGGVIAQALPFGFGQPRPRGLMRSISEPPGTLPLMQWSEEFIWPSGKTFKVMKTSDGYCYRESTSGDLVIPGLPPGISEDDLKHLSW